MIVAVFPPPIYQLGAWMETYLEGPIYLCIYLSIYLFIDWSRSVYRDPRGALRSHESVTV